jgi:hypothetical protein
MKNRHQRLEEHRDNLRADRTALQPAPTSNTFRGVNPMGRQTPSSGVALDKWLTWSIRSGRKLLKMSPGSPPEQEE